MSLDSNDFENWATYRNAAVEIVKEAGRRLSSEACSFEETRQFQQKTNEADLVSAADVSVQNFIFERLSERFPEHFLFGEESTTVTSESWRQLLDREYVWVLDPGRLWFV